MTQRRDSLPPSTVGAWFALAVLVSPAVVAAIGMVAKWCG